MGDSGRHCSCSGRNWKSVCNAVPPIYPSSVSPLSTSGRLTVASRGHVINTYINIYVIYVCVNILCWGVQGLRQW